MMKTLIKYALLATALVLQVVALSSCGGGGGGGNNPPAPSPPAAPTMIAPVDGNGFVTLGWSSVSGATSYNIYRTTNSGIYGSALVTGVTATTYTDNTVANGTTYYYVVKAVNSAGEGFVSSEVTAHPHVPAAPPAAPVMIAPVNGDGSVTLGWSSVSGATSYSLYRSTTSGSYSSTLATNITATAYTDTAVTNLTTYYYVVKAVNSAGEGPASSEVTALPAPLPPLSAPVMIAPVNGDGSVTLGWSSVAAATSYSLYRSTTSGSYGSAPVTGITGTTFTDATVANFTTYYYIVKAVNFGGEGPASSQVTAHPGRAPAAPTGLDVVLSSQQTAVTWNAVPGAASYKVYYALSPGLDSATGSLLTTTTSTSYTHGPLSGMIYYYMVRAINSYGAGPESAVIAARLASPQQPSTVMAIVGNAQVTIDWSGVPGAVSYTLYRDLGPGVSTVLASNITGTTAYVDAAVTNGTAYYYAIKGVNSFGTGPASLEVTATPVAGTPGTITVSGRAAYEDREYDTAGFTGVTSFKPVRYAGVELIDSSTAAVLATGMTTSGGAYALTVPSTNAGKTVYVRTEASSAPAAGQSMNVKDLQNDLYAGRTLSFVLSGDTAANLAIPLTSVAGGAFNILEVMTSSMQFVNQYAGTTPALSLSAFWSVGNPVGTYYCPVYDASTCPGGLGLYVYSDAFGSGDTDEYDDDVIMREFGRFVLANYSLDSSVNGTHSLDVNDYDMRLTWTEGFVDFFPGAVKYWLDGTDPNLLSSAAGVPLSEYVDTAYGSATVMIDIADPDNIAGDCGGGTCLYSTNEIAVANVLWNHMAGTGSYGMQWVWDVIAGFKASPPAVVNLEAFWDRWKTAHGNPTASIYTGRSIDYSNDIYENDDDAVGIAKTIIVGNSQSRKLYSAYAVALGSGIDTDVVKFDATASSQYTIATSNLRNGADTYLTLYDTDGTTLISTGLTTTMQDNVSGTTWVAGDGIGACTGGQNYDCYIGSVWQEAPLNTTTNLASRIVFTPALTGTYYIVVTPSPNRPRSAGKYGSYTLSVTSP